MDRSAETVQQQLNVYAPTCLDIWLNEPRNAPESRAPANLLRLWFPESILAHDSNDNLLWEYTFERRSASWQYVNESMGDMKRGQAVRKVLQSVDTVDGLALIDCSARWRETDIDLTLRITNVGPMAWSRLQTSICLQRPAAPDYLDEENTRTYLVSDEGFVASAELVFPPRRRLVYAWMGEELPMKEGTRRRLAAPALFVVSKDERYVLGYAWQQARRLFLNRAGCVKCLHSDPEFGHCEPQHQHQRQGIVFVNEGTLEDAYRRYCAWSDMNDPAGDG